MWTAKALCHQSTFNITSCCCLSAPHNSFKLISSSQIPTRIPPRSSGFASQNATFTKNKIRGQKTMTELVKASGFSSNNGNEGTGFIQNEDIFDGSSVFRPQLVADGLHSTINRLSKWLVSSFFGAIIIWRHDGEAVWAVIGAVVNSMLSIKLKKVLNQERPMYAVRADPGMPSSHAQSIFFIVVFVVISILEWLGVNKSSLTISGVALAIASYFTWLRVSQKLHTLSQVLVGAVFGSTFSMVWFWLWSDVVQRSFISSLWVRISVLSSAVGFGLLFLVYVSRKWLKDEL